MAISVVGVASAVGGTASTIVPSLPAGTQADDIIVIVCGQYGTSAVSSIGYTQKLAANGGSTCRATLLWKRHSGSEDDPGVEGADNSVIAFCMAFRGVSTDADPWDSIASAASSDTDDTAEVPSLSTAGAGAMVIGVGASADNNLWGTFAYGNLNSSNRSSYQSATSAGNDTSVFSIYGEMVSAGSIGALSAAQLSNGPDQWVTHAAALKPLASGIPKHSDYYMMRRAG